jgi:hypothetical protein
VASDVRCTYGSWLDESKVLVQRVPSGSLGSAVGGIVVPHGIGAIRESALDVYALDVAVGRGSVEEERSSAEEKGGCVHADGSCVNLEAWSAGSCYCCRLRYWLLDLYTKVRLLVSLPRELIITVRGRSTPLRPVQPSPEVTEHPEMTTSLHFSEQLQ